MNAVTTYALASELQKLATISPTQLIDSPKSGVAVLKLKKWDHHEWHPNAEGVFEKGALIKTYTDIVFAVERHRQLRQVRVVACLAAQVALFPLEHWHFRLETSDTCADEEGKLIPFGNLGTLGAMLRSIHYWTERVRRNGQQHKVATAHAQGFMAAVEDLSNASMRTALSKALET